ncbi:AAA family ATPase [Candidatus Uhrbacteria bacterium]|nr:AAA family ATPase [Candidatus Uhrbacteria bacterium]
MKKYLIVGVSGSGKSTVENELWKKGYRTIDIDQEPRLTHWINKQTGERAEYTPGKVSEEWLNRHAWLWDEAMMTELLNRDPGNPVFVVGVTSDILDQLHRFDKVFLLQIPPSVVRQRLEDRPGQDEFGKSETEVGHVLSWQGEFEKEMIIKGAIVIDAQQPVEVMVQKIIANI